MVISLPWLRFAAPLLVVLLAAVLRLWNLGNPQELVFDETFYVKDAWSLFNNGYESTWPTGADELFAAGQTNIFETAASFVVHPPLGKWLIALGMAAGGADSAWGWRISTAIVGILAVVLLMLIARRLFNSLALATIAGFLLAIDGNAIVMSRVALLDNYVMFFALLGFGAVLLDRPWHTTRLGAALERARLEGREVHWGPVLWWRPWLLAAGLAFGLATSVKWSGVYFLAAFGLYLIAVDALARRRAGLPFWVSAAVLKQGPATFLLLVPIALVTFLASWTGWFVTRGGYYRDWASQDGNAWTGAFAWVPEAVQSFWHYQNAAYIYHVGLSTPHPYQSSPLSWLLMTRPTSMFYEGTSRGEAGCSYDACSQAITGLANPLIWWASAAALLYLVYRFARDREWQVGLILMGMVAGYLPWLMYLNRTVFQFYTIAFEPYLILGLTFTIGVILGKFPVFNSDPEFVPERRDQRPLIAVFLVGATLISAFFYPLWAGIQTSFPFWQVHMWLQSWV